MKSRRIIQGIFYIRRPPSSFNYRARGAAPSGPTTAQALSEEGGGANLEIRSANCAWVSGWEHRSGDPGLVCVWMVRMGAKKEWITCHDYVQLPFVVSIMRNSMLPKTLGSVLNHLKY